MSTARPAGGGRDRGAGIRRWRAAAGLGAVLVALLAGGCRSLPGPAMNELTLPLPGAPERLASVLAAAEAHRVQVLVSEVVVAPGGAPGLRRHGFRVDAEYFYPASSIKLCAAVAALQELERLRSEKGTADLLEVPMEIAPLYPGDAAQTSDPGPGGGRLPITVGREIRKLALVSDNLAYNRLYDLVGREGLNRSMHGLGLDSAVLNHRLSDPRPIPDPGATAQVVLRPPSGDPIVVPARTHSPAFTNRAAGLRVGRAYLRDGGRVEEPMDFGRRNGISLLDLQDLLVKVVRPDIDLGTPSLRLTVAHREHLLRAMTEYPRESRDPVYPAERHPDETGKFLLPGVRRVFPAVAASERIQITGKIGRAYGFSVENACLFNPRNGRTLFVTAVIYTNDDGVLNDDRYEYEELADPFLADLGEWVSRRWLSGPPGGEPEGANGNAGR